MNSLPVFFFYHKYTQHSVYCCQEYFVVALIDKILYILVLIYIYSTYRSDIDVNTPKVKEVKRGLHIICIYGIITFLKCHYIKGSLVSRWLQLLHSMDTIAYKRMHSREAQLTLRTLRTNIDPHRERGEKIRMQCAYPIRETKNGEINLSSRWCWITVYPLK